ncbi:hypothetical protein [Microtetraspora niveoalba]|uniref:hypothetical protein n=1 Tax=Microtetraspora niveoalba TaxID=46175 RepID=UPI0012F975A6|nr:hypothetical protein [Microtetraspora niveoalba]
MDALGRNAEAAQDFFVGDPTALRHYLTERRMADGGAALGGALEAATLTFRDHEGSSRNPSRGYLSAKLASEFVHLQAERIHGGKPSGSFVRPASTGRILAGYISDVDDAAHIRDTSAPGVADGDLPVVPGREPWSPVFRSSELLSVMEEAFTDPAAFVPVLIAQTAFTGRTLDHGATEIAAGRGRNALSVNAVTAAAGAGLIGVDLPLSMDTQFNSAFSRRRS